MKISEKHLIEKLKQKNYDTFETFYYAYVDYIHYIVSLYIKNSDTIDDLTQEIFMRILDKIYLFNSKKSSLKTWIYTLAKNHTLNYLESHPQNKIIIDQEIVNLAKSKSTLHYELTKLDLKDALTDLEYQVLFLKIEGRLKHEEIASVLNITVDKSKKTYRKAINIAKEILK